MMMIMDKSIIVLGCLVAAALAVAGDNAQSGSAVHQPEEQEAVRKTRDVFHPHYYNNGQYYNNYHYQPWNYNNHPYRHYPVAGFPYRRPFASGAVNPNDYQSPALYSNDVRHPDGSYYYDFETANGIRRIENSVQTPTDNVVQGSYSHVGPDGRTYTVNYIADKNGYRAVGDHLPQQPQQNSVLPGTPPLLSPHPIAAATLTTPKPVANKVVVAGVRPIIAATAFPPFNYNHPYNYFGSPYHPRPYLG